MQIAVKLVHTFLSIYLSFRYNFINKWSRMRSIKLKIPAYVNRSKYYLVYYYYYYYYYYLLKNSIYFIDHIKYINILLCNIVQNIVALRQKYIKSKYAPNAFHIIDSTLFSCFCKLLWINSWAKYDVSWAAHVLEKCMRPWRKIKRVQCAERLVGCGWVSGRKAEKGKMMVQEG